MSKLVPDEFDPAAFGSVTSATLPLENGMRVVMRVNGVPVSWDDFIAQVRITGSEIYRAHPDAESQIAAALASSVKDTLVAGAIYREFAQRNRLLPEAREVDQFTAALISGKDLRIRPALPLLNPDQLKQLARDSLIREKVAKFIGDQATSGTPSAADLKTFIDSASPTTAPARVIRARHIVIRATPDMSQFNLNDARAHIEEIHKKLTGADEATSATGALDFAAAARRYSQDRFTAYLGGDLGYFRAGTMYPEVNDALEKLKPGDISPVVRTKVAFHLFQLTERHDDDLLLQYGTWKKRQAIAEWMETHLKSAHVENYLQQ